MHMDVGIVSKVSGDVDFSDLYVLQDDDDTGLLQRIYTLLLCSVGDGTYRPTRTTQIVYDLGSSNIQDINVYRAKLHTAAQEVRNTLEPEDRARVSDISVDTVTTEGDTVSIGVSVTFAGSGKTVTSVL